MRSHVKVYFDFDERTEMLTEAERGRLLLAMLHYAKTGEETELRGNERFLWPVFKSDIDRDVRAYDAHVQAGANGGRPRNQRESNEGEENQQKPNETKNNQTEPKNERQKKEEQEQEEDTGASHTGEKGTPAVYDARAREGGYIGPDGIAHPCRYDSAWKTSERARRAVCQRVINGLPRGICAESSPFLFDHILDALQNGVPPEWIEDAAKTANRGAAHLMAMISIRQTADQRSKKGEKGRIYAVNS